MAFTTHQSKSSYRNLPINIHISSNKTKSKTAIVLHPGAFEPLWGDNQRYKHILLWLKNNVSGKPTVVTYQTSRENAPIPNIPKDQNYWPAMEQYWQHIFMGKTFKHELDDVQKVFQFLISQNFKEFYSVGFSLGGTIAMILTKEFPQLKKVCVLGSAISTKRAYLPVLTGYPKKEWILERIHSFPYYMKIFQGFEEKVVPFHDAEEVFAAVHHAKLVSLTRIAGADHMFSGKNKYGLTLPTILLPEIKNFLELTLP